MVCVSVMHIKPFKDRKKLADSVTLTLQINLKYVDLDNF